MSPAVAAAGLVDTSAPVMTTAVKASEETTPDASTTQAAVTCVAPRRWNCR